MLNPAAAKVIAITDCGSTTTKAILIEQVDGVWRQTYRGDAPTTVEAPAQDVTLGVAAALRDLCAEHGRELIDARGALIRPAAEGRGVDLYLSTSSAGGGLQMLVAGLVQNISAESAERAALGAGAIVADVIAYDDPRPVDAQIERVRAQRPDMVLLAGGTDGGAVLQIVELAELIAAAKPRPRFGADFKLPVVFAGNLEAADAVRAALGENCDVFVCDNLRPTVEAEVLAPARAKIHDIFLDHVMRQAPGFSRLVDWADAKVVPTPSAVGALLEQVAARAGISLLCVDIGGATTDLFSVVDGCFRRTVSANLGMSYSATNVLEATGAANILRWLPFSLDEGTLCDEIMNKTVRPTTVPETLRELLIEQALAREALRLSATHHRSFAAELAGVRRVVDTDTAFTAQASRSRLSATRVDLLIGSGGVLSHAPRLAQTAAMLIDAFEPEGITRLAKDAIFMLPHLGVLATVLPEAALAVFDADCLVELGTCIAPIGQARLGRPCLGYTLTTQGKTIRQGQLCFGALDIIPLLAGSVASLALEPARGFDLGQGPGKPVTVTVQGGAVGLIFDCRGRPLRWPEAPVGQETLRRWLVSSGAIDADGVDR